MVCGSVCVHDGSDAVVPRGRSRAHAAGSKEELLLRRMQNGGQESRVEQLVWGLIPRSVDKQGYYHRNQANTNHLTDLRHNDLEHWGDHCVFNRPAQYSSFRLLRGSPEQLST